MTVVDWVALGLVLLAALGGAVQGFVWSGLSLAGLIAGAFLGGRLAPLVLANGSSSHYAPVVALIAAVTLAVAFEVLGSTVGGVIRSRQQTRGVRALDSPILIPAHRGVKPARIAPRTARQNPV